MPARLAIEPTLRSKSPIAITTVIVAGDDGEHAHLLGDVEEIARGEEGVGQIDPEKGEQRREAERRAVAAREAEHAAIMSGARRSRARAGSAAKAPRGGNDRRDPARRA